MKPTQNHECLEILHAQNHIQIYTGKQQQLWLKCVCVRACVCVYVRVCVCV